jgi:hypothetical protein
MSILKDPVRPLDPYSQQEFRVRPPLGRVPTGRGELLRTVEEARRHLEDLHGAPLLHQPTWALDLD